MEQHDFYKEMVKLINNSAKDQNPENMANFLYFHMKQYPDNVKVDHAWEYMLKNIKILLNEHFNWKMIEIHEFFIKLQNLTKYMKKSA